MHEKGLLDAGVWSFLDFHGLTLLYIALFDFNSLVLVFIRFNSFELEKKWGPKILTREVTKCREGAREPQDARREAPLSCARDTVPLGITPQYLSEASLEFILT